MSNIAQRSAGATLRTKKGTMPDGEEYTVTEGSGNVFADLGLPDAGILQLKASLAFDIKQAIEAGNLTQSAAAKIAGIDQPTLSKIVGGRRTAVTVDKLFEVLSRLGRTIEVRVRPTKATMGSIKKIPAVVVRPANMPNRPLPIPATLPAGIRSTQAKIKSGTKTVAPTKQP